MLIAAGALMPVTVIELDVMRVFKERSLCSKKLNVSGMVSNTSFGVSKVVALNVLETPPMVNVAWFLV